MNQLTTKWLNLSITASETGGEKTILFLKPHNSEGVELIYKLTTSIFHQT
jgi:hypothetical protein